MWRSNPGRSLLKHNFHMNWSQKTDLLYLVINTYKFAVHYCIYKFKFINLKILGTTGALYTLCVGRPHKSKFYNS